MRDKIFFQLIILLVTSIFSVNILYVDTYAQDNDTIGEMETYSEEVLSAYIQFTQFIEENNIYATISLEDFAGEYKVDKYASISEYLEACYSIFDLSSNIDTLNYNGDTNWYYNTGTYLMDNPNYDKYNLLNKVSVGDILYEDRGGSGLTGHIAIVEGIFYDTDYSQFYIRLVEGIGYLSGSIGEGDGVCRSVLDDDRFDNREGKIVRVTNATASQKNAAVNFCIGQIGKGYNLDLEQEKDTSSSEIDWYCSELVWAAYKNQGIDLDTGSTPLAVSPRELRDSSLVSTVTISTVGRPTITQITTDSSTSATITWSNVIGASKYNIYRATSISGPYSLVTTTTSRSFKATGHVTGSTYYYRVSAYVASQWGNPSMPYAVTMEFGAPKIIRSVATNTSSVALQWNTIYNATEYYVYRSTTLDGTYTQIAATSSPSYVDNSVTSNITYYYKVAAHNSSATSSRSAYKSVKPTSAQRPTIYYCKELLADNSLTIKWTNVPNATKYYIYRSSSSSGTYTKVGETTKTIFTNASLASNTKYYYKVKAYVSGITSDYSYSVSGTTGA